MSMMNRNCPQATSVGILGSDKQCITACVFADDLDPALRRKLCDSPDGVDEEAVVAFAPARLLLLEPPSGGEVDIDLLEPRKASSSFDVAFDFSNRLLAEIAVRCADVQSDVTLLGGSVAADQQLGEGLHFADRGVHLALGVELETL